MGYGARLEFCRVRAGYTMQEAAEIIGVSRNTLSNYEHDKTEIPLSVIVKMSYLYKTKIFDMLGVNSPQIELDTSMYYLFKANATVDVWNEHDKDTAFGSDFSDAYYTKRLRSVLADLISTNADLFPDIAQEFEQDRNNVIYSNGEFRL